MDCHHTSSSTLINAANIMSRSFADAFNARHLSPQQVAETFVIHDRFDELWQNDHVVLLGPRGSGKTTLLKMLTAPALHTWKDERAVTVREAIPFRAIYIPTDVQWNRQLQHSTERLSRYPELMRVFSEAAVTTNVLASVCDTFRGLLTYEQSSNSRSEAELCKTLIQEWRLKRTVPVLEGVAQALRSRVNDLYVWANRTANSGDLAPDAATLEDFFYLDYLAATAVACGAFDDIYGEQAHRSWALCFDELELAPQWLQERLFNVLRSTNQRFLFKLSTSPTPNRGQLTGATERNDFRAIRLWPHTNHDPQPFSDRLVRSILARRRGPTLSPDALFGLSPLSGTGDEREYERGSATWYAMRELARYDHGFRDVLSRNGIDPENPTTDDIAKRDQVLRKAKPLVLFRRAFTKPSSDGTLSVRRSRKVPTIYAGKDAVYDIADGNPRWLIGIINDLLAQVPNSSQAEPQTITAQVQAKVLKAVSEQFGALVETLPEATAEYKGSKITLYELLQRIANYFFRGFVQRRFTLDPVGSFIVDANVPQELLQLLRKAVYEGAIVMVNPTENAVGPDLTGKRFRLSYRLAPALRLPLRLYEAIPLTRCLEEERSLVSGEAAFSSLQQGLELTLDPPS
jgi:energy-coupling factor transporter ATP-binding protein EcfA2